MCLCSDCTEEFMSSILEMMYLLPSLAEVDSDDESRGVDRGLKPPPQKTDEMGPAVHFLVI